MSTSAMQEDDFVTTLNTGASNITGAYGWVAETESYPTLSASATPQADGSVE